MKARVLNKTLKSQIDNEISQEKCREQLGDEEYDRMLNATNIIRKRALEDIRQENNEDIPKKRPTTLLQTENVSDDAHTAYMEWKRNNPNKLEEKYPEISVKKLLLLLKVLQEQVEKNPTCNKNKKPERTITNGALETCLKRHLSNEETFWDSSSNILRALRRCVLTRDWDKMIYFLLILANYEHTIPIIKNFCFIMLKLNPLIRDCGLENEFTHLTQSGNPTEIDSE